MTQYFTCSCFTRYIRHCVIFLFLLRSLLLVILFSVAFIFDHKVCKELIHIIHIQIVFKLWELLLCQMFQCNKVVYTVEFSVFPVIWVFIDWTLGEASSTVVHLNSEQILHCSRQAKGKSSVLSHSADSIVYTCSWFTGSS